MTCADFEEHIALDAGGDLPERDRDVLAEHLRICPSCRDLAAALSETQRALTDWSRQPADDVMGAEVRRRVQGAVLEDDGTIAVAQQRTWAPAWGWAVAALLILGLGLSFESLWEAPEAPSATPRLVLEPTRPWSTEDIDGPTQLALADLQAPALEVERPPVQRPPAELAVTASAPDLSMAPAPTPSAAQAMHTEPADDATQEPMLIQLVSDDNSVVIYWLVAATS